MILIGCNRKQKSLCERFYKELPHEVRKGNALWSWEHKEFPNPDLSFIKYMSKRDLAPKFVHNVPLSIIAEWSQKFEKFSIKVPSSESTTPETKPKYDEWDHLRKDGLVYFRDKRHSFDGVRSWVMSWYWRRDGRLPNPPVYKRNAASLHLHLSEVKEESSPNEYSFQCALEEIKNLWY